MSSSLPPSEGVYETHRAGLDSGVLRFQLCECCGHRWLPPREECPQCLRSNYRWEAALGTGRVISWVIFHRAYDPDFTDQVPYNVILVELDEGPRLLSNLVAGFPVSELPVRAQFGGEDVALVRFVPAVGLLEQQGDAD